MCLPPCSGRAGRRSVFWYEDLQADSPSLTRTLHGPAYGLSDMLADARGRAMRFGTRDALAAMPGFLVCCGVAAGLLGLREAVFAALVRAAGQPGDLGGEGVRAGFCAGRAPRTAGDAELLRLVDHGPCGGRQTCRRAGDRGSSWRGEPECGDRAGPEAAFLVVQHRSRRVDFVGLPQPRRSTSCSRPDRWACSSPLSFPNASPTTERLTQCFGN